MENIMGYLFLAAGIAAIVAFISHQIKRMEEEKKLWKTLWNTLETSHGFWCTQHLLSADEQTALAVDTNGEDARICLITRKPNTRTSQPLPAVAKVLLIYPADLLCAELFEDGSSVTKTSRGSQVGGVIFGGLILGAAGAIIGGLSGKTVTSVGKVKRIDLRLIINDTKRPIYDINFLDREVDTDSGTYSNAKQRSRHWHGLMEVLIRQADAADKKALKSSAVRQAQLGSGNKVSDLADDLEKLFELRQKGLLSSSEYQEQKSMLLNT